LKNIDVDTAHEILDFLRKHKFSELREEKGTIKEKEAIVESDSLYREALMELKQIEADLRVFKSSYVALDRYAKTISREITRREKASPYYARSQTT